MMDFNGEINFEGNKMVFLITFFITLIMPTIFFNMLLFLLILLISNSFKSNQALYRYHLVITLCRCH